MLISFACRSIPMYALLAYPDADDPEADPD